MIRQSARVLLLSVVVFVAGGASCLPRTHYVDTGPLPPAAFTGPPTLDDVVFAVNANSRVERLQTQSATLTIPGAPKLRADLAIERPRRIRLRAELTQFTGRELDLGSNDDVFWMWIRRSTPPALFYARHDEYARSPAATLLPVEPGWLIDALGIVNLDPGGRHEGPFPAGPGRVEVRSPVASQAGELTRVLVVDDRYGWILEQHLYDANQKLLASAYNSKHRFYPLQGLSLPHHVELQLAPGQPLGISMQLDVSQYLVNQLYGEPAQLWALPEIEGYPLVNLADPRVLEQLSVPARSPAPAVPSIYAPQQIGFLPTYRGLER